MSINSISPVDGRYQSKTSALTQYFSEKALIKYRIFTETEYLLMLSKYSKIGLREFNKDELRILKNLYDINDRDAEIVKEIETIGYNKIPATNHDVKAIEYFIKTKLADTTLSDVLEMVHFALTSEDVNNVSYGLMIRDGFNKTIFPEIINIYEYIYKLALSRKDTPMLARTHGQPASPTTFGKEMLVFVNRLKDEIVLLKDISILVKLNGATGNYNAHQVSFEGIDWQDFTVKFIEELKKEKKDILPEYCSRMPLQIKHNKITTQIEPHDSFARLFDSIKRINTILIDFCMDTWRYISDGWIKQKAIKGEIGSSAMPHKVNPIDFENAEGNLGIANALFNFFSSKLSISRLQRDLTDSTVLRNIGVGFAHSLIAYQSLLKGLSKIKIDNEAMLDSLKSCPEVIAEAYQNLLRINGFDKPYEMLKEATRGKKVDIDSFYEFARKLNVNDKIKEQLLKIKPENYLGIAQKIVEEFDPVIY